MPAPTIKMVREFHFKLKYRRFISMMLMATTGYGLRFRNSGNHILYSNDHDSKRWSKLATVRTAYPVNTKITVVMIKLLALSVFINFHIASIV